MRKSSRSSLESSFCFTLLLYSIAVSPCVFCLNILFIFFAFTFQALFSKIAFYYTICFMVCQELFFSGSKNFFNIQINKKNRIFKYNIQRSCRMIGSPSRTRTCDTSVNSRLLLPTELSGNMMKPLGLEPRTCELKVHALPTELRFHIR